MIGSLLKTERISNLCLSTLCLLLLSLIYSCSNVRTAQSYDTYSKIRVEYSSTSDWTTLDLLDSSGIVGVQLISAAVPPSARKVSKTGLAMNQPLASANAGNKISMIVDFEISSEMMKGKAVFQLNKGYINSSYVRISLMSNGISALLKETVIKRGTTTEKFSVDLPYSLSTAKKGQQITVTVKTAAATLDLSVDMGPVLYRASGYLHNPDPALPASNVLDVLKPKYFRSHPWRVFNPKVYSRVKQLGAVHGIVVSDEWGYGGKWPGDPDPNDNANWKDWEKRVRSMAIKAKREGRKLSWDIWNEPDALYFWNPDYPKTKGATWNSADQFLETYRRAVVQIRSVVPDAEIVGPSLASFSLNSIKIFLDYCKANDVLPNAVSWHEFETGSVVPHHVNSVREHLRSIGHSQIKIYINEYLNDRFKTNGARAVEYFAGLEQARVDAAAKACWGEVKGGVNSGCSPKFFNNMVTVNGKVRSVWWAYKGYADITHRLIGVTQGVEVFAVAGTDPILRRTKAVLGRISGFGNINIDVINLSSAPYLRNAQKIHVHAMKVSGSKNNPASNPVTQVDLIEKVVSDRITITLPQFAAEDIYLLTLTNGSR